MSARAAGAGLGRRRRFYLLPALLALSWLPLAAWASGHPHHAAGNESKDASPADASARQRILVHRNVGAGDDVVTMRLEDGLDPRNDDRVIVGDDHGARHG